MKEKFQKLHADFEKALKETKSIDDVEKIRLQFLGRRGKFSELVKKIKDLSDEEKKEVGTIANETRDFIVKKLDALYEEFLSEKVKKEEEKDFFDFSEPEIRKIEGSIHPITKTYYEIVDAYTELGFDVVEDREIEDDFHCFEALNIPKDHPARDMQDTFYLNRVDSKELLLRTHTSSVQIRYMEKHQPPIKIIVPGRTFRRDDDITHTPMFMQFEGLVVSETANFSHLKYYLSEGLKKILGGYTKIRFRISYFPFVEPGAEVDVTCIICKGKGCRVCKKTGWVELGGCGVVHPNVFTAVGIDPKKYQGFAWGFGIERVAMMKYGINDSRLNYENHPKFLEQFNES